MKFYQKDIETYESRVSQMRQIQETLDKAGLSPNMPAIALSEKKVVLLSDKIEVKERKDKLTGEVTKIINIAGYTSSDGGKWYEAQDLVQFSDSTRILYLK